MGPGWLVYFPVVVALRGMIKDALCAQGFLPMQVEGSSLSPCHCLKWRPSPDFEGNRHTSDAGVCWVYVENRVGGQCQTLLRRLVCERSCKWCWLAPYCPGQD